MYLNCTRETHKLLNPPLLIPLCELPNIITIAIVTDNLLAAVVVIVQIATVLVSTIMPQIIIAIIHIKHINNNNSNTNNVTTTTTTTTTNDNNDNT